MSTPGFSVSHIAALQRHELDDIVEIAAANALPQPLRFSQLTRLISLPRPDSSAAKILRNHAMSHTLAGISPAGASFIALLSSIRGYISVSYTVTDPGREDDVDALLRAHYPGVIAQSVKIGDVIPEGLAAAGLLVGSPAPAMPESPDDPGPADRLVMGLSGLVRYGEEDHDWVLATVAEKLSWSLVTRKMVTALAELRTISDQDRGNQPLAAHYKSLLQLLVERLNKGRSIGLWSVSTTLAARSTTILERALALAQSIYSGSSSLPDPMRSIRLAGLAYLPPRYTAPPAANSASQYWTGAYCSLMHSEELAAVVAPPNQERPGLEVRRAPRFKQMLPATANGDIILGTVLERGVPTALPYSFSTAQLSSHSLVAGASGSGKTNTVFQLLRRAQEEGVPFLILEPTKTEYRALMNDPVFGQNLQVFTAGDETIAPLRLNPFEIPGGTSVQTHIDRLKSTFNASFTMYAPMPQVLERCLIEIYEDRGWDLAFNVNARGQGPKSVPTLGDLHRKIEAVVPLLGYDQKISDDVSAALRTRIDSLRIGSKGMMLETYEEFPIEAVVSRPTVIELDNIGDDDEKAFLAGLIFTRLAAEMTRRGPSGGTLRHLTVMEEAHRVFLDIPLISASETGNPKGKAVQTFCDILSEIRAYGAGIVVVDQIPVRLAKDAIKNTNLKIMHRLPASDDREAMGHAMAQTGDEISAGAALPTGTALVHLGGQDGSYEVLIPKADSLAEPLTRAESDQMVRERFSHSEQKRSGTGPTLRQVQLLLRDPELAEQSFRLLQSFAVVDSTPVDVLFPLLQMIGRKRGTNHRESYASTLEETLVSCIDEVAGRSGWPVELAEALRLELIELLGRSVTQLKSGKFVDEGAAFRTLWESAGKVPVYPFPQCSAVCPGFVCRYKHVSQRLSQSAPLRQSVLSAFGAADPDNLWGKLVEVTERAIERALSGGAALRHRRGVAGCFTLHSLDLLPTLELSRRNKVFRNVLADIDGQIAKAELAQSAEGSPKTQPDRSESKAP